MVISRLISAMKLRRMALFYIVLLSLVLTTLHINLEGFGNLYYAAGVKSMLENWHNFFYLAYDPGGFVTIDKPPLGFWMQAASASIFGFHGWALMLPQIIASVLTVILLYSLVSKVFGSAAGLTAALIQAVMPISVAAARNNTIDSILVLSVLAAAWMLFKALEENGGLKWVLAAAAIIGIGFNIKMLEAYLVLPAFGLLLFLSQQLNWRQKLSQFLLASATMTTLSLSWAFIVDLTPVDQRPYVGSTQHNSVLELALQHNAAGRFHGYANPFRLMLPDLGGQISWLLPLSTLCAVLLLWKAPILKPLRLNLQQRFILFWLAWLIPMIIFFGTATLFHRYYLVMMAPAIAAISGAGMVRFWKGLAAGDRRSLLSYIGLPVTGVFAVFIAWSFPEVRIPLSVIIISLTAVSLIGQMILPRMKNIKLHLYLRAFICITGLLSVLAGPVVWASTPAIYGKSGLDPVAGPELQHRQSSLLSNEQEKLLIYLQAHFIKGEFLVATPSALTSSPFILSTGLPVMTMGGYNGLDPILSENHLQALAQHGKLKYFLIPNDFKKKLPYMQWIHLHCRIVSAQSIPKKSNPSLILYQFVG